MDFARAGIAAAVLAATLSAAPAAAARTCAGDPVTILGTPGEDAIRGTSGDDVISGLGGSDTITGLGGDDVICAGPGSFDEVFGGAGNDKLIGGRGDDELYGGKGNDLLRGGRGVDRMVGDAGHDLLRGGKGLFNSFVGGNGADVIVGGVGTGDVVDYGGSPSGVIVDLAAGTASGEGQDQLAGIETVFGSGHDDTLSGDALPNELAGRAGNDTLTGGGGGSLTGCDRPLRGAPEFACSDILDGEAGDDTLIGGDGFETAWFNDASEDVEVDLVAGRATGDGTDSLSGVDGAHGPYGHALTFLGDDSRNAVAVGSGDDHVDGGNGTDLLVFTSFEAVAVDLAAGTANGAGSDTLLGFENVVGTQANDTIHGDDGPNELDGRGGNDSLFGRGGDDLLVGGTGSDRLDGGAGTDLCEQPPEASFENCENP